MSSIVVRDSRRERPYSMRDAILCVVADGLFPITGFVVAVYLTRTLGPAGYGLYSLLFTIILSASILVSAICRQATIRTIALEEDWRPAASEALRAHLIIGGIFSAGLFLAAPLVAALLRLPEVTPLLRVFTVEILLFALVSPHRLALIARGLFRSRAFLGYVYRIGRMVFIVSLVAAGLSVEGAILGNILASCLELLFARRLVPIPWSLARRIDLKNLFRLALPLMAYDLCFEFIFRADIFLLRLFGGEKETVGYYAAAQMAASLPLFLTITLSSVVLSTATRLRRDGDHASFHELARRLLKYLLLLLPFSAIVSGSAGSIMTLLFGQPYARAADILAVLCYLPVPVLLAKTAANFLVADDRAAVPVRLLLPVLPVMILLVAVLAPLYGAVGVAWSIVSAFGLGAVIFFVALQRLSLVRLQPVEGAKVIAISTALFFASACWQTEGVWLVLECMGLACLAILILFAAGLLGREDLRLLGSLAKGR